jgi:ATP-dependent helicase HrpB
VDSLPIYELETAIRESLLSGNRLILRAPTGSGKSTQVPRMLLKHGLLADGGCVVLQPRRIAARMLAARVAWEQGSRLGGEIGYRVRFDSAVSRDTRVTFVTEGILLRELVSNPDLQGISTLVFDEFHERHLYTDVTLGCALRLQETSRPDLRILVMSATLDTVGLEQALAPARVLESAGRTFPVSIQYLQRTPQPDSEPIWETAANTTAAAMREMPEGNALVFMPGAFEIQRTLEALGRTLPGGIEVLPLHGELPADVQDAAVADTGRRKVIVATNVAETSLTIPGVRLVVDSGLARIARFDPHRGINTLLIEKISRASADQRAGRAGRIAPGVCIRLWTERDHADRRASELPEIRRLDLSEVLLTLKAAGVPSVRDFRWLEQPDPKSLDRALELLDDLGALDGLDGPITDAGRRMLAFPMHPRFSRMLVEAERLGCVRLTLAAAALAQNRSIFVRTGDKGVLARREELFGGETSSDFLRQIAALEWSRAQRFSLDACSRLGIHAQAARQAAGILDQFTEIARKEKLDMEGRPSDWDAALRKCLLAGFSDQVARRLDRGTLRCAVTHGRRGTLSRDSAARDAMLLVVAEIGEIGKGQGDVETILSMASEIEEPWLRELFPRAVTRSVETAWDAETRRCVSRETVRYRDLVLREIDRDDVDYDQAAGILAARILDGTIHFDAWRDLAEPWLLRVATLRRAMPELEIPEFTAEDKQLVLEQFCHGAAGARDLKDRDLMPWLLDWLPPAAQQLLHSHVPERIELPSGRKARIIYDAKEAPKVSSRVQDFYGIEKGIAICGGRIRLKLELLAPNQRPVQVTESLETFWRDTYPKLKQELSRRYPRHEWR